jgi:UbiD family decarboxylase
MAFMLASYIEKYRDEIKVIDRGVALDEVSRFLRGRTPVLFKNLGGFQAVGNLFATRERIASALTIPKERIASELGNAISHPCPTILGSSSPPLENVSEEFNLLDLPFPLYYKNDGGRYLTSGIVCAEFEGKKNMSFHRMMIVDKKHFAARLVERHLYTMYKGSLTQGQDLKVAICIGVCPSLLLAAAVSTDYNTSELEIASALRKNTIGEEVATITLDGMEVPAFAEYVLVGRLTRESALEGPFVDITGTYDTVRTQPLVRIEKVYHKNDPLMYLLLPGGYEHYLLMGLPREPTILKSVSQVVPRVNGARLTEGGCCWLHGVVSITKQREGDGKNAIMAAFSGHPSMKRVVVVDADIDIYNDEEVEWALATRFQADKDLVVVSGARGSTLDPSSDGLTTKIGLDATKPLNGETFEKVAE